MLVKILLLVVLLVVVLAVVIAMRPSDFRYERSITIAAPASAIFPYVNNQHEWLKWSPWANLDPNIKQNFAGPDAGVGSVYSWDGNKEVGAGESTIIESRPDELVKLKLEFFKPFKGINTVEFIFKPEGDKTVVSWIMYGPTGFMGKAFGLFVDCEKMCGGMFEKGLASLKENAESLRKSGTAAFGAER